MDKSLYSLMLMDSVVREIDRIALQKNTNRSNLVNQILAEYVSLVTPEQKIDTIFRCIAQMMQEERTIVPYVEPNHRTMSLRSSLAIKYRPTIRYEVQLHRVPDGAIGVLNVVFRTQSSSLLELLHGFFVYWSRLEAHYLPAYFPAGGLPECRLEENRFVRSIVPAQNREYSTEEIGTAISAYVKMLDTLLKEYLDESYDAAEVEARYRAYLSHGIGLI